VAAGGVGGDADFAGGAEGGVALEGDHVGGRGVGEEVGVELGEVGVGEEDEGEFAGRSEEEFRFSIFDFRMRDGGMGRELGVEEVDDARDGAAVEAEARVAVGEGDGASVQGGGRCG
jgi:hypothetical protein